MERNITPYLNKNKNYYNSIKEKNKEQIGSEAGSIDSEDSQRYEIDTDILLERVYNSWLGRTLIDGIWQPDEKKKQMMSKEFADKLITSIRLKINTHSNLSTYDEDFIKKIALETCLVYNEDLMYESVKYKVKSSDYKILITDLKHLIMQLLRIALHGGMKIYRAERGKININRVEQDGNIGGLR